MTAGTAGTAGSGETGETQNPSLVGDAPATKDGFRRDIQGLRGFAVMLVVVEHVVGQPRGAFVGLEFFFVISGFLITGLLLREADKTGRVSIRTFYQRRVRRIFPAAMVALAATVIAGKLIVSIGRYDGIVTDAWWTLGFLSNWHFIAEGTDYFHQTDAISPLRHYWSLSVEEQWYVVWPVVVLVAAAITRRVSGPRVSTVVAWVAGTMFVASFGWAVYDTHNSPLSAYFSTFTRAWEIAVGAWLAAVSVRLGRLPDRARNLMGAFGVVGIAASTVVLDSDVGFPAPTGLLPVGAAALVIAAGTGTRSVRTTKLFWWRPLQYFGKVSYSLYLVHWPVLIYAQAVLGDSSLTYYTTVVGGTIACTLLLHYLIEMPVLHSKFLLPWSTDRRARRSSRRPGWLHPHNALVGGVALAMAVSVAAVAQIGPAPQTAAFQSSALEQASVAANKPGGLQRGLQAALARTTYPKNLVPPLGDVEAGKGKYFNDGQQCLSPKVLGKATNCVYGNKDAANTAVVFGDSIAVSYLAGIVKGLGSDWRVHGIALSSCPAADVQMTLSYNRADQRRCNTGHGKVYAAVRKFKPDLVVVTDSSAGIQRLASGNRDEAAVKEWRAGMVRALRAVKAPGRQVVVLAPNPLGPDPSDCYTRTSKPKDCVTAPVSFFYGKRRADQAAAKATGARYVSTLDWFCYRGKCPIFGLGLTMRWDGSHITRAWSEMLSDRFAKTLVGTSSGGSATTSPGAE